MQVCCLLLYPVRKLIVIQLRSADEGSTILYTVRVLHSIKLPLFNPTHPVRRMQTRLACKQLSIHHNLLGAKMYNASFSPPTPVHLNLHIYTRTTEKRYDAETAEYAGSGGYSRFTNREGVFR
jgi:hypothetical protein